MPDAPLTWVEVKVFSEDISEELTNAMIATVWSRAQTLAPCLKVEAPDPNPLDDPTNVEVVKSVLRAAVLRWDETGSGGVTSRRANEYQESLSEYSGGLFRPDEIATLRALCTDYRSQKANTILTAPIGSLYVQHALWCSITFGGNFCDCGAELTASGLPLWSHP